MNAKNIKGITIKIGGDTTGLDRALKNVTSSAKVTETELRQVEKAMKLNPSSITLVKQKYELLTQEVAQSKTKIEALKQAQAQFTEEYKKQNPEEVRAIERELVKEESYLKKLTAEQKQANIQMSKFTQISKKMKTVSTSLNNVGNKLSMVSAGAAVAVTAVSKLSIDAEDSFTKVNSILGLSGQKWTNYENTLKAGAKACSRSYSEYAEAAYQAISASVKQSNVTNFLSTASKLAKGGLTDLTSSVDLLTTIQNAYNLKASDTSKVSDILIETQNRGKTTVNQLCSSMGKIIPIAKNSNVNIKNLGASISIMTRNGMSTKNASTYLTSMLTELSKNGSKSDTVLRSLSGKSFAQLTKSGKSVGDVLGILNTYAKKSGVSLADMFSNSRAGTAALSILKNGTSGYAKELNYMTNSTGKASSAAKVMGETTKSKLTKAINSAKNAGADFGATILPMLTPLIEKATELVKGFSNLDDGTKKLITRATLLTVAAAPAVKTAAGIAGGISKITELLGKVSGRAGTAAASTTKFAGASKILASLMGSGGIYTVAIGAAAIGLAALATSIAICIEKQNKLTNASQKSADERNKNSQDAKTNAETDTILANQEYSRLKKLMKVRKKSASQQAEIKSIVSRLNEKCKSLNLTYDAEKDKLSKTNKQIKKHIEMLKQDAIAAAYKKNMITATEAYSKSLDAEEIAQKNATIAMSAWKKACKTAQGASAKQTAAMHDTQSKLADATKARKIDEAEVNKWAKKYETSSNAVTSSAKKSDKSKTYSKNAKKNLKAYADGTKSKANAVKSAQKVVTAGATAAADAKNAMKSKGRSNANANASGIKSGKSTVSSASTIVRNSMIRNLDGTEKAKAQGQNATEGYAQGATSSNAFSAISNAASKVVTWFKNTLIKKQNSGSPAKYFNEDGKNAVDGYAEGANNNLKSVKAAGIATVNAYKAGMSTASTPSATIKANVSSYSAGVTRATASMSQSPTISISTETGSVGNDVANALNQLGANQSSGYGNIKVVCYMYPNASAYGEATVKTYDTYKRRLG